MDEALAKQILEQLRSGELNEYKVEREQFLTFQPVLAAQDDMKAFRGNAQVGGDIIFKYEHGWTA